MNTKRIKKEIESYDKKDFKLGEYIYMGMAKLNGKTVCISVGYKIDYCIKKGRQFTRLSSDSLVFYKVNKIKVGELEAQEEFFLKL